MDSSNGTAAVLVAVFILFVALGVVFVGGDDGGTEADRNGGRRRDPGGRVRRRHRARPATDSPVLEPYDERAEYEDPHYGDLNVSQVERLVVERTNEVRANRSLDAVTFSETLADPTRDHSTNMSEQGYVGHIDPAGGTVEERYVDECAALRDGREEFEYSENAAVVWYKTVFESSLTEENVYARSEEGVAEVLVDEWLASDAHRDNLLTEGWETVGVGIGVGENGTVFGTQAFCSVGG